MPLPKLECVDVKLKRKEDQERSKLERSTLKLEEKIRHAD